jgi:hypothetical protein
MRIERLSAASAALAVSAWAADTRVPFEVSDVAFDGRRLRATFRYPPSDVTTTSELELVNPDRLEGVVTGAYRGRETWLRAEPTPSS